MTSRPILLLSIAAVFVAPTSPGRTEAQLEPATLSVSAKIALDKALEEYALDERLFAEGAISRGELEASAKRLEAARRESTPTPDADLQSSKSVAARAPLQPLALMPTTSTSESHEQLRQWQVQLLESENQLRKLGEQVVSAEDNLQNLANRLHEMETELRRAHGAKAKLHPFLETAREFLGVPYLWGGASFSGMDCSGLILATLRRHGIVAPHSAAELFKLGQQVDGALQPGDLVFFTNTYKPGISHVGLYVGGNEFLHASSGRGRVTIGNLDDPYYVQKYAGARRIATGTT